MTTGSQSCRKLAVKLEEKIRERQSPITASDSNFVFAQVAEPQEGNLRLFASRKGDCYVGEVNWIAEADKRKQLVEQLIRNGILQIS